MQEMYNKSLQKIKELEELPTKAQWNKIAKENCLLSYVSMQFCENKPFPEIWKSLRETEYEVNPK